MTPEQLSAAIVDVLATLSDEGALTLPDGVPSAVTIERPRVREHGDYATNVALQLAKKAGVNPRELAGLVQDRLQKVEGIAGVDIAGPGFLNIRVEAGAQGVIADQVVEAGPRYGASEALAGQNINLEFVSANPTGPLHIGGVRWAAVGDALGRVFEFCGAAVTREYYFNDHGAQIDRFSSSLLANAKGQPPPEDGYGGDYIGEIARAVIAKRPEVVDLPDELAQEVFRNEGVEMMFAEVKQTPDRLPRGLRRLVPRGRPAQERRRRAGDRAAHRAGQHLRVRRRALAVHREVR